MKVFKIRNTCILFGCCSQRIQSVPIKKNYPSLFIVIIKGYTHKHTYTHTHRVILSVSTIQRFCTMLKMAA